ncbi:MAG: hypothetical protein H6711_06430 [Myxococcales bacterium]|nr:hypothetical protein [Myxococcales bacterium]
MVRSALAVALTLPLTLAGCSIFSGLFKTNASTSTNAGGGGGGGGGGAAPSDPQKEREAELSEAHRRLASELDASRQEIAEAGVDSTRALRFADLTLKAYESEAVARGRIDGPVVAQEALGYLAQAKEAEPAATVDLASAAGSIHARLGDADAAGASFAEAIAAEPRVDLFNALAGLSAGGANDTRVVEACPKVRPQVSDDALPDFMAICLDRAGGDAKRLSWKGSKQDLAAYQAEMRRREEEAKRREAEEAKRREEEAKEAAQRELYAVAAVFAAGRCEFGDCAHRGWSVRTDQGEVRVSCSFGDCLTRGWEARFPDGKSARTDCSFGECLQRGWETRFPDGSTARTSCSFGECATRGWETHLPDGSTSRTTCSFSECFTRGWETSLPSGGSIRCTCSFGECLTRGTECN